MTPIDAYTKPAGMPRYRLTRLRTLLPWILAILMLVFSAPPLANDLRGRPNKDYSLWCQVGEAIRQGRDVYPDPASGRLFPFMYPPSAAALLGFLSPLGRHGLTLAMVLSHSVAWLAVIALSIHLATGSKGSGQHPLILVAPSLCIIALIHNTYLLGQPNLMLLALLLGAFACLRAGRDAGAGILVATAAAIKAFPILALGYLVYRRMWRASAWTIVALAAWLLVAPLPFRTPAQAVHDLVIWSKGMVFTYNSHGIAQRPYRSFSFKNQSIMAMAHRLLRDVPADGEVVLSRHAAEVRARRGRSISTSTSDEAIRPDGSFDLKKLLATGREPEGGRWEDEMAGAEEKLRSAWRVNVASLDFRAVTAVTVTAALALTLLTLRAFPPRARRTDRTDTLEYALVTLLIVIFSPLSFNYAFVWLIYPTTLALYLVLTEPSTKPVRRRLEIAWVAAVLLIPATAVVAPLYAQALGNLFVPALLLVVGLSARLRAMTTPCIPASTVASDIPRPRGPHRPAGAAICGTRAENDPDGHLRAAV